MGKRYFRVGIIWFVIFAVIKTITNSIVGGSNQAEYGTIKGKVISINEVVTINQEKGNVYF
ncbi:MAG: hypothetical protein AB6733_20670 [Clostridiaceae bacterium]